MVIQTLVLLAVAILVSTPHNTAAGRLEALTGGRRRQRWRPDLPLRAAVAAGGLAAVVGHPVACLVVAPLVWWGAKRLDRPLPSDESATAAEWDLLAACLGSGMPVPAAIRAVAGDLPDRPGAVLRDTADLLALGADPVQAWAGALACPETAALARGARRTARSGVALAAVARSLARRVRDRAPDAAEARAQRVGVLITGPLGLCFLPAFLCLGITPVVIGLAAGLTVTH